MNISPTYLLCLLMHIFQNCSSEKTQTAVFKHQFSSVFSKSPALSTFNKWAIDATKSGGSVSFSDGKSYCVWFVYLIKVQLT